MESKNNEISSLKKRVSRLATELRNCEAKNGLEFGNSEANRLLNELNFNPPTKKTKSKSRSIDMEELEADVARKLKRPSHKFGGSGRRKTSKKYIRREKVH
jgi:hypothetical protein